MDVDGLRSELEKHLAGHPDAGTRDEFRGRFERAAHDPGAQAVLQRICDEAEAATRREADRPIAAGGPVRMGIALLTAAIAFGGAYYFFRH